MTALPRSVALPGDDVFVLHDRPLRDGVALEGTSRFGDAVWRLQPAIHKSSGTSTASRSGWSAQLHAGPRASVGRLGGDEFAVVLELPAARLEQRLAKLVRMLHIPVVLDDGRTVDVAASVGAATPDAVGSRDLTVLQRAADAALYDGKHSGHAAIAAGHTTVPSINGRRTGRPGTAVWGRAA